MFGCMDCFIKCFIFVTMASVKSIIAYHFEIPFGDVLHQKFDKINRWYGFAYESIILVSIVMECHRFTIIRIDASECNDRTSKISANILEDSFRIAKIWFGIDIESIFVFFVNESLGFPERRTYSLFHFIEESSLKGFS